MGLTQVRMEMQAAKVYPGLLCNSLEFFRDGFTTRFFSDGRVRTFSELPSYYVDIIREYISQHADIDTALKLFEPDSEVKRLEKFCECRFGGLDFKADIKDGVLQDGDYWECPVRDICPGANIVCKPLTYNGHVISVIEIKLIRLLATDFTNEVIADELSLAQGTLHLFKKNLYQKLDVKTKQELTLIGVELNLLQ